MSIATAVDILAKIEKKSLEEISIIKPDDFHVHLRQGEMLEKVAPYTARHFKRALVMPNTIPAILNGDDAQKYFIDIMRSLGDAFPGFEPLMTIKITDTTTPAMIERTQKHYPGLIKAGKAYPVGVTTNSDEGVTDFTALESVFQAMSDAGMVLCLHGEHPDPDVSSLKKEEKFIKETLPWIVDMFPKLKIVLEHISTLEAIEFIYRAPRTVAATIAIPHLFLTLDDVIGGRLQPHHFCKPIPKTCTDMKALQDAAMSGSPRFFLGTDSAPHARSAKECACGAAGSWSAPIAIPALAQLFDEHGKLEIILERFTSVFGAQFYGLPQNTEKITLVKKPWTVPDEIGGIVPLMAGKEIAWRVI